MNAHRFLAARSVRLAFAFVLLLVASQFQTASVAQDDPGASDLIILRSITPVDGSDTEMLPLDPRTLEDESTSDLFGIDPGIMPGSVVFSRDGQTLAGMRLTPNREVIVKRGLDGPIVSRIPTKGPMWPEALSADGSKLLVTANSDSGSFEWKTFDTATGALTAEFAPKFGGNMLFLNQQEIDPVAWKLYRLYPDGIESIDYYNSTGAANLVVVDLTTGDEAAPVRLSAILIGSRLSDENPDLDHPMFHDTFPGIAISPDGSEIAVASATDNGITLVDAKTMTIKQTFTMHEQTGLIEQLFALVPLAPQTASAKATEGEGRTVFYAADGNHLYVSGYEAEYENGVQSYDGFGLSIVDLNDGEIESHVLDGVLVHQVAESANGDVYVTGMDYQNKQPGNSYGFAVARLEGDADNVLAERTIGNSAVLILAPNS